jgi:beta-galactosidase
MVNSSAERTSEPAANELSEALWRDTSYVEAIAPSTGTLPTTAHAPLGTARSQSLDGQWRFRLSDNVHADASAPVLPSTDVSDWNEIPVPGHWPMQGWGRPWYTNQFYPFPIDAPHVPDANPTGTYVLDFEAPVWDQSDTVLRFDGVDSIAQVWLNGEVVGVTRGSRLPQDFDVTDVLQDRNRLVVRVHQWSAMSYLEDQDMWWLPGIFRSVTLRELPVGRLGDVFVHADYDAATTAGHLSVQTSSDAVVTVPELGVSFAAAEGMHLPGVHPWSAESPKLYDVQIESAGERQSLRVGFRRLTVEDGLMTVNGRPLMLRGVNRHEFDTRTGRTMPFMLGPTAFRNSGAHGTVRSA